VRAGVSVLPLQLLATQTVVVGCRRQAPLPLQPPARPQVAAAWAGQVLRGSCPLGTAVQVPGEPARLQAKQVSVQALAQQTPSAQKPLLHWPVRVQAPPGASLAAQRPALQ
jgi:hypothetical protein